MGDHRYDPPSRKPSDRTPNELVVMPIPDEPSNSFSTDSEDLLSTSKIARKRFLESMEINYEKWHDGIGYDLTALDEMTQADKDTIVDTLSSSLDEPWRSFEALEHINSPKALAIIENAMRHPRLEVRIAASRFVKGADKDRERVLIEALERSDLYAGLSQALDQVETFHPQGVIDALLRGLLERGDSGAVNFAGMLLFVHGKADSSFDWSHRPLFLRFETDDLNGRKQAFVELCSIIRIDPSSYLNDWSEAK